MSVQVICCFYNEEFLLPFFLSHYRWADEITAIVSPSTDRTYELLRAEPNVRMVEVEFPDGIDDVLKRDVVNRALAAPGHEWRIVVDSDEFVWPAGAEPVERRLASAKEYLASVPASERVLRATMFQVFRHRTDSDLDPAKEPVALQRRHGLPVVQFHYQKPAVLRALDGGRGGCGFRLGVGNHNFETAAPPVSATHMFDGAHWQNADPAFAVTRRIRDRRNRMSRLNLACGLGIHQSTLKDGEVEKLMADHMECPLVI